MLVLNAQRFRSQLVQGNMNHCTVSYLDAQGRSGRCIAVHDTTLLVNQELGEVPLDVVSEQTAFAGLQELVDGCNIITIDINLTDNRS
jgi:hypothetical protein